MGYASKSQPGQARDSACLAQKVLDETRSTHVDAWGSSFSRTTHPLESCQMMAEQE